MNVVCFEYDLLRMWSVMNRSVMNVACNEGVCYKCGL